MDLDNLSDPGQLELHSLGREYLLPYEVVKTEGEFVQNGFHNNLLQGFAPFTPLTNFSIPAGLSCTCEFPCEFQ